MTIERPLLWDLETPHLYVLRTRVRRGAVILDERRDPFGVRTLEWSNRGFFLNGQPVKLRGGCVHPDHGPLGVVGRYRAEERRIERLKAVGFNAIRYAHNAPNPAFLAACDRVGMLVISEFADTWDQAKKSNDYSVYFGAHHVEDLRRWVLDSRLHPSVAMYSIGNEIGVAGPPVQAPGASADQIYARSKELAGLVRLLDRSRPITQGGASNQLDPDPTVFLDVGDVHYDHDHSADHAEFPKKPYLQSESFPVTIHDDWATVQRHAWAIGDFTWAAWDYIGEAAVGAPLSYPTGSESALAGSGVTDFTVFLAPAAAVYPYFGARCGDFDLIGDRRGQSLYRSVVWGFSDLEMAVERPLPGMSSYAVGWGWFDELESWTWPDVPQDQTMTVRVYTSGDHVDLLLNGARVGALDVAPSNKRIATFNVAYASGNLTAVSSRNGREIARRSLTTAGTPAGLHVRPDHPTVTNSREDLAYFTVDVVDGHGRRVRTQSRRSSSA